MDRTAPIRVLHITGMLSPGGIESFLMNLHTHIDRDRLTFDFAVHMRTEGDYGERMEALGGSVCLLPRLTADFAGNLREIRRLVTEKRYDVVVRHSPNAMITPQLLAAKKGGAKTVCHAHNETDPKKAAHYAGRLLMNRAADACHACSEGAGRWMFGNRPFTVLKNAIDIEAFRYRPDGEARIRAEFGLGQARIYGNIANFRREKNHLYLLKVFRLIRERDPEAVLICLGDGALRGEIEEAVREQHLEDSVILAGTRGDVADMMSAMDVLLFPSVFEGLPVTLVETQAACLPALVSDRVTKDAEVTERLLRFMPIDGAPDTWAKEALRMMEETRAEEKVTRRVPQTASIAAHGYDIRKLAERYADLMEALV